MTDDRNEGADLPPEPTPLPAAPPPPPEPPAPPPEPPAPPPPPAAPVAVAPARASPLPWVIAGLLGLTLVVLVALYFMGVFEGDRRREEIPWNSGAAAVPPPAAPDPMIAPPTVPAPPPATDGQVTEAWLMGRWGESCPGSNDPDLTFEPGGRFLLGQDPGSWTMAGNIVTVRRDGRPNASVSRWEYLGQDSARLTNVRSGSVYYVNRCP